MDRVYKVNLHQFLLDARGCLCIAHLGERRDVWFVEYSSHFQHLNALGPVQKEKDKQLNITSIK